ncbi:MAG: efflux RND transporter periplasmic adaptor subunit [Rickettsiales bacterium]|nr:efflux RND transporter periplasmic adaptor subunit [Rickettsiales bacterium]
MRRKTLILILLTLIFGCIVMYLVLREPELRKSDFEMIKVKKGDVVYSISATGNLKPLSTVDVGTQVSGIIDSVLVDYNDEVKSGQLLAQLDTSILVETKNEAEANLKLAEAQEKAAKNNFERTAKLYKDKLTSKTAYEEQEVNYKTKQANTLIARAHYNKAKKNYDYAFITSPVSGTVISKEVEVGQTVAASLSAPTFFQIAEDLSKMQIETSIAEADIGVIKEGMNATFTVDAYQGEVFNGKINQVRLSPTEESNVVMYTVIIDTDNSHRKLLPGMTASVTIKIQESLDTVTLSTMALQYKPKGDLKKQIGSIKDLNLNQDIVYIFKDKTVQPVVITKGLSDVSNVEILDGLKVGDEIIIEQVSNFKGKGSKKK